MLTAADLAQVIPYQYHDGTRTLRQHADALGQPDALAREGLVRDDRKLHVLFYAVDVMGCGYYRCFLPSAVINGIGGDVVAYPTNVLTADLVSWAHVVVWERSVTPESAIIAADIRGLAVNVYDVDDDMIDVPAINPAYDKVMTVERQAAIRATVGSCHAYLVPNGALGRKLQQRVSPIPYHVLPNMIHPPLWTPRANDTGKVRVGWAGSTSHHRDLSLVLPAMRRLLAERDDVTFVVMGFDGVLHDGRNILDGIPHEYHDFVSPDHYPDALAELRLDVGLAPIEDAPFNGFKSPLKWQEYSALGVATVASRVGPYKLIEHGVTGLLATHAGDFYRKIKRVVDDAETRRTLAENARQFVLARMSSEQIGPLYEQVFHHLYRAHLA